MGQWLGMVAVVATGIGLLMAVHEGGHHLVARLFGLRVEKFSFGIGPVLFRHQRRPEGTVYQVALIPFIAFVQIAGMNPFEEHDENDSGSYANASLWARTATIAAGPLANYFFAALVFFAIITIGGREVTTLEVKVLPNSPAARAGMLDHDEIVAVEGQELTRFEDLPRIVVPSAGKELKVTVERGGQRVDLSVVPEHNAEIGGGRIGVEAQRVRLPVSVVEGATFALGEPGRVLVETFRMFPQLPRAIYLKVTGAKGDIAGPAGMAKALASEYSQGWFDFARMLAYISAGIAAFNLLPIPALDGGRLAFLTYEAVTRRRPDAKLETLVHGVGILVLLAFMVVITVFDVRH